MKENTHYVYAHINPTTKNIFYIGIGYKDRCYKITSGRNKHYLNYIEKHGKPSVIILHQNLTREEAIDIEQKLIMNYGRIGYEPYGILVNKSLGGEKSNYGVKQSKETKDKKSRAMYGKKIHSEEQKLKWKQERKGRKNPHNENIIKSDKDRPKPEGFDNHRSVKVLQYDLDGNFIKEWESFKDIYLELNIKHAAIWSNIKGNTKQSGGFKWKYKN
jgi:hypothetical protein